MPRLHSIHERLHLSLYDAVPPRAFHQRGHRIKIFGDDNVGNTMLTNINASTWAGAPQDTTFGVREWYARTNISEIGGTESFKRAWHAWTNAVTFEFVVGSKTYGVRSLAEMLMSRGPINHEIDGDSRDSIAKAAWLAFHAMTPNKPATKRGAFITRRPMPFGVAADDQEADLEAQWRCQPPDIKHAWFKAATANNLHRIPVVIRQKESFGVIATSDPNALSALLEVIPTDIAPRALVWVHLDGWTLRPIY